MLRSVWIVLAASATVLAQGRDDQTPNERPRQFGDQRYYGPILGQIQDNSLLTRLRQLDRPLSTGLVRSELPDEALIDLEAWLREPIPPEELALRRIGFRRPARGTIWREDFQLPDEETLRQNEALLRGTIRNMQGIWRVQKMIVDGRALLPEEYAGLKYLFQDTVLFQSETSENWSRSAPASATATKVTPAVRKEGKEPGEKDAMTPATEEPADRLGPAGTSKPAGGGTRYDPRQEEGVRLQMLYRGEGAATVYWWDRDGEVVDPHESRNRQSLRVSFPARGGVELADGVLTIGARGVGLRALLPTKFHYRFNRLRLPPEEERTPLEPERTVLLVMVRDEDIKNPMVESRASGESEDLGAGEPGSRTRRNIIPQMRRVPLTPGK